MENGSDGTLKGVGKQVTSEHRQLDSLFRRAREALAPSSGAGGAETFARLRATLDAHLAQEDSLYYPPIWVLRPEYKDALQGLVGAHDDFRRRLAEISAQVERGTLAAALAGFDAFVDEFGRHELAEEQLLEEIERGLPRAG
jgi:hypothetical protein